MKASERRAERNKTRIVQSALDLFQARGIKKVAITDIAQRAGVSPATVYNQFGSKDTLVLEVVKKWYIRTIEDYRKVLRAEQPFEEKLQSIMLFKTTLAGKLHGEFYLATISDDPEIQRFLESNYMVEIKQSVAEFFYEGKKQGYINPEVSMETYMRFTEILRKGLNAEADLSADPDYSSKLLRDLTPLILYGMFGK
jgi:AcrR family transcriptional regulator